MKRPGDVVKKARVICSLTQKEFAKLLGRAQSEVSKYERNLVDPPGSLIMHCMNIIDSRVEILTPSVDSIIEKLNDGFNSPKYAMARSLIMGIIVNEKKRYTENSG